MNRNKKFTYYHVFGERTIYSPKTALDKTTHIINRYKIHPPNPQIPPIKNKFRNNFSTGIF